MKTKKIPMRSCVVTREKLPKMELLRIVKTPTGEVVVDPTGKLNGKGCYIKKELTVLEDAKKRHVLYRALEVEENQRVKYEKEKNLN